MSQSALERTWLMWLVSEDTDNGEDNDAASAADVEDDEDYV